MSGSAAHAPIVPGALRGPGALAAGVAWLLAVMSCALQGGCGAIQADAAAGEPADGQTWIEPIDRRVDAVTGMMLILPVRMIGSLPDPLPPIDVRLSGGAKLAAVLRWITIHPEEGAADRAGMEAWLPPAGRWSTSQEPPTEAGLTMTVAAIQLPAEGLGQDLVIGRRRIKINWLPDPAVLCADPGVDYLPALPAALRENATLEQMTRPERLSPVRRWRYRLMMTGLHPAVTPPRVAGEPGMFADPVLEALAEQTEARWTIALGLLRRHDPQIASELTARLCAVAAFDNSVVAPVWTVDQAALDDLLGDLLDPSTDAAARAAAARRWVDGQPASLAWVMDDAAEQDGVTRLRVPRVGVVNLSTRPVMAWAMWLDAAGRELGERPQVAPLGPQRSMELPVPLTAEAQHLTRSALGDTVRSATLAVHAGSYESRVHVGLESVAAQPPGVLAGPLVRDLTLDQFLGGRGSPPPEAAWSTRALLYRTSADSLPRWELYIACSRPAQPSEAGFPDQVTIHAGPRSRPRMVLRIDESGGAELIGEQGSASYGAQARITREADRWVAVITLPSGCIEEPGVVRLGLVRTDGRGVRTAWPRPMLPWQETPARSVIELAAWDR